MFSSIIGCLCFVLNVICTYTFDRDCGIIFCLHPFRAGYLYVNLLHMALPCANAVALSGLDFKRINIVIKTNERQVVKLICIIVDKYFMLKNILLIFQKMIKL